MTPQMRNDNPNGRVGNGDASGGVGRVTAQLLEVLAVLRRHNFSVAAGALTAEAQLRGIDLTVSRQGVDAPSRTTSGSTGSRAGSFRCPVCAREFTLKSNLRRHVRTIHGGAQQQRFSCEVCGESASLLAC